jgi:PAS domain S-box-containing protein
MRFGTQANEVYANFFHVSPMALSITSARDSRYLDVNRTFERVTGWTRDEVIGRTPADIGLWVHPDQRADMVERLLSGETVRDLSFTVRTKNSELRLGLGWARLVDIDGESCVLSCALDVTDSERTLARLRDREEHFRLIANTVPVTIWSTGLDRGCTYVNQLWLDFTGRPLDAMLGFGWADCLHPDDVEPTRAAYFAAFERREPFRVEYRLRRHDGEYRWFLATGVPRQEPNGAFAGYIGSAMDISERKRLEEAVSALSQRLIAAHEEERARVARELRDDINQRLAVVNVQLHMIKESLPPSTRHVVEKTIDSLAGLVEDLEDLSQGLYSPRLPLLGLAATATSLCHDLSQRHNLTIDCCAKAIPAQMPPQVALCLFRVLQEALQNAIRHSGARHIEVRLTGGPQQIELVVRDSGKGFELSDALQGNGLGLASMRERLKLVGGKLWIDTQVEAGATIRALVPLTRSV